MKKRQIFYAGIRKGGRKAEDLCQIKNIDTLYRLIDASNERSWHSFKKNRFPGKSEVRLKKKILRKKKKKYL